MNEKRKIIDIPVSPLDRIFREEICKLLHLANDEIIVMAGELSSYDFLDLRDAFDAAVEKGVKAKVYAINPPIHTVNRLVLKGVEVYVGKRELEDHYTVVDRKHWAVSKKHTPYSIGERRGKIYINDPHGAWEIVRMFEEYTKDPRTKKYISIDWENDPILRTG
jgi:sugar-specific transcriptional regulator TrmB